MDIKSIRSVAETYYKMYSENSEENLAATDAAQAQKDQEPMGELPDWVPGDLPDDKKKEFVEAVKQAYESDNTQFDFDGRTYKITEKLVGDQDKLDVNNNGKIDADDLAALRSGKEQANEHHVENEIETPGQTEYPGSGIEDVNGNGIIDGEDKAKMSDDDEEEKTEVKEASGWDKPAPERAALFTAAADSATKDAQWHTDRAAKDSNATIHALGAEAHNWAARQHAKASVAAIDPAEKARHAQAEKHHREMSRKHNADSANSKVGMDESVVKEASEKKAYDPNEPMNAHVQKVIHRDYLGYKAMDTKDVLRHLKNSYRVHSITSAADAGGKPGMINTLLRNKHGDRHVDHYFGIKEGAENPTDTLTIDVPAMIRALEKAREDFKTDEDIHNFVQGLLKKKDSTIDTNALPTNEALDPKADAGVWIKDFQDSDDPKFAGKSKDERKQQALAAWYAARRDAGIKEGADVNNYASATAFSTDAQNATKNANWHSERARNDNDSAKHGMAATAHARAAKVHTDAAKRPDADEAVKAQHAKAAQYHTEKSLAHADSADTLKGHRSMNRR